MEETKAVPQNIEMGLAVRGGLVPTNLDQLWRLSLIMAKSGLMPKGLQTPEAICVAVQMGLEVGLTPMASVQNIAVINGRPAVWGDSGLALVEASGLLEDFRETISEKEGIIMATCFAKRTTRPSPVERTFSTIDAKTAGLHGKEGPWRQYPKRMTQMRARWWVLRDLFPDVLKGLRAAEEVQDIIDVTPGKAAEEVPPHNELAEAIKQAVSEAAGPGTSDPTSGNGGSSKGRVVEDPIRAEYLRLKSTGFRAWVQDNVDRIPQMEQVHQDEIREKWAKLFPRDEFPKKIAPPPQNSIEPDDGNEPPPFVDDMTIPLFTEPPADKKGEEVPITASEVIQRQEQAASGFPKNPPANGEVVFPAAPDYTKDEVFYDAVADYWAVLDKSRVARILEAFEVKNVADVPILRRKVFIITCKQQLDKQNADK